MKPMFKNLMIAITLSVPLALPDALLAASDATTTQAAAHPGTEMALQPMQQNMQRMQEEMAKLHDTKEPKERSELLRRHGNSMQGMMKMMHGMMAGQGMMSGQSGGMGMTMPGPTGTPGSGNQGMGPGAMAPNARALMGRMGMLEQRMNMMQMMMDQMLQHQELLRENRSDDGS